MSVKISELPLLNDLADNDVLASVDTSANATKKIELATLKEYIDTNTQYTAGTNIDITDNVVSAPNVYNKTEVDEIIEEKDEQIEELQEELDAVSTIYNAFPTVSDEDTSMTLDGTAETKFKKFDLLGNTSQETTTGKNLLDLTTSQTTIGGIPISVENGVIKINGTTSSSVANWYCRTFQTNSGSAVFWLEVTGYTDKDGGNASLLLQQSSDATNWSTFSEINLKSNQLKQYDVTLDSSKYYRVRLYTSENTFTNATIKAQLEYGSSKTDFEPYTNGASPNPDYPQDIHVVSGDNTIEVDSGDALQGITLYDGYISSSDAITSASNWKHSDYIDITDYDYYIVEGNQGTNPKSIIYNANKSPIQVIDINYNSTKTWNLKSYSGAKYLRISTTTGGLASHHLIQRSSYQVNLPIENLFDESQLLTATNWSLNDSGYYNGLINDYFSKFRYGFTFASSFKSNTQYSIKLNAYCSGGSPRIKINYTDNTNSSINLTATTPTDYSFTTPSDKSISSIVADFGSGSSETLYLKDIMLQEGTKQNSFTPYGTTPIELNKIGDYQDYFYKDNGSWYLHKEIGKYTFKSGDFTRYTSIDTSTRTGFYTIRNDIENYSSSSSVPLLLNRSFISVSQSTTWVSGNMSRATSVHERVVFILGGNKDISDIENVLVGYPLYYPLATTTDTEITYQPLIEQLNAIEKAMSYNGQTNISQVNNDESFIISAEAIMSLQNVLDRIELLES